MENNIFIPKIIKVGYQKRGGTYTGKLAYIIYIDDKKKVRKEKSWNSWRDKGIKPNDFDNEPTSGFVLNKKAGGYTTHWNTRNTYCRVYDPRGFEFEISISNLLYILENTSSIKGKGLEGEFTYGWSGTELLLLPVGAPDYKDHQAFSDALFGKRIGTRDMVPGRTYKFASGESHIYLGRFPEYSTCDYEDKNLKGTVTSKNNFYFFKSDRFDDAKKYDEKNNGDYRGWYVTTYKSLPKIAQCLDEGSHPEYAWLMDFLEKDERYKPKVEYVIEKTPYTYDEFAEWITEKVNGKGFYGYLTVMGQNAKGEVVEKDLRTNSYDRYIYRGRVDRAEMIFTIGRSSSIQRTLRQLFDLVKPVKIKKIKKKQKKGELQNA